MKRLSFIAALFGGGAAKAVTLSKPEICLVRSRLNGPLDTEPGPYGTVTIGKPKQTGTYNTLTIRFNPDEREVADRIAAQLGDFSFRIGDPGPCSYATFDTLGKDRKLIGYSVVAVFVTTDTGKVMSCKEFRSSGGTISQLREQPHA